MWSLFLKLEAGRPGRGEGNWCGDTDFNTVQHPKQLFIGQPIAETFVQACHKGKDQFYRTEESRKKRINVVICEQEGKENQVSFHPTRNIDCLTVIQWGTFSGRLIILYKGKPDGYPYCKKQAIKKRT